MSLLSFPLSPAADPHHPLSPVIDRPDRRTSLLRRATLYLRRARFRGTLLRTIADHVIAKAKAQLLDLVEAARWSPRLVRSWPGVDNLTTARSIALYIHYSPTAEVSDMVLNQLATYRYLGFCVVFTSMCPSLPADLLPRLQALTGLVILRRNHGLDFGAWHDLAPLLQKSAPNLNELLLVNDSVCGPLRPLSPILTDLRAAGDGLFGLTENLAPRPHLQSYFLLARGPAACADTLRFLARYRSTADKRHTIRHGEVRLSSWMRAQGHDVAARYGYQTVEATSLRHARTCDRLRHLFIVPRNVKTPGAMLTTLQTHPVNPTHALWDDLITNFNFPFLKTDLLTRNPLAIADIEDWRDLTPPPIIGLIEGHLKQFAIRWS